MKKSLLVNLIISIVTVTFVNIMWFDSNTYTIVILSFISVIIILTLKEALIKLLLKLREKKEKDEMKIKP